LNQVRSKRVLRGCSNCGFGTLGINCTRQYGALYWANPPFDHPHVFLDLGNDNEIICPYCSTLYRYAADLKAGEARPPECVLKDKVA
jgi:uncharacterized Zn-finger protein